MSSRELHRKKCTIRKNEVMSVDRQGHDTYNEKSIENAPIYRKYTPISRGIVNAECVGLYRSDIRYSRSDTVMSPKDVIPSPGTCHSLWFKAQGVEIPFGNCSWTFQELNSLKFPLANDVTAYLPLLDYSFFLFFHLPGRASHWAIRDDVSGGLGEGNMAAPQLLQCEERSSASDCTRTKARIDLLFSRCFSFGDKVSGPTKSRNHPDCSRLPL